MKLFKKLEDTFAAAAFAEAGEFDTAREMLKESEEVKIEKTATSDGHENLTGHPSKA